MFRWIAQEVSARAPRAWSDGAWTTDPAITSALPSGETAGWVRRSVFLRVPDGAYRAVIGLSVQSQGPDDYAIFDDVSFRQIVTD